MDNGLWRRGLLPGGLAAVVLGTALAASVAAASRPVAYCAAIPMANVQRQAWGFHGGHPITGATGSYTRGHGTIDLAAGTATGIICQSIAFGTRLIARSSCRSAAMSSTTLITRRCSGCPGTS